MKQDKLTTWLEYVSWEYLYYERYTHPVKAGLKDHDEAWQKLVDATLGIDQFASRGGIVGRGVLLD
jgi:hypothetical protein